MSGGNAHNRPDPASLVLAGLSGLSPARTDGSGGATPQRLDEPLVKTAEADIALSDPVGRIAETLGTGLAQVFLFIDADADFHALVARAAAVFGATPVVACTTAGEIGGGGYSEGSVVGIGLPAANFATRPLLIRDLDRLDSVAVIGDVIRARMGLDRDHPDLANAFAFLLVDGLSLREDQLAAAIASGLGPVPMFGGSAGDGTRFRKAQVAIDGAVHTNAAVLTFVRTPCRVEVFSLDNLVPGQARMVVTRADPSRRLVCEINAEPAAREYARLLGKNPDNLDPFTFAAHPLVVRVGGRHHVRSIQRVTEKGELVFFSAIDEGIVLTLADAENLCGHLDRSLDELAARGPVDTILACDCFLRRVEAGQKQQTRVMSEILSRHRVVGFNTYGEQVGATHVNQTMTGVAIYRTER